MLELIDVTQLPYLKDGKAMQVSSYDRTGGNDDGFSGAYSFVRKEGSDWVIFDEKGPGCIQRIWAATYDTPGISFYLDGSKTPEIELPSMKALFDGTHPPFAAPISGIRMGAGVTYLPIPFAESCKIVVHGSVNFYQVSWQKYPVDTLVTTFSMNITPEYQRALDRVKDIWSDPGRIPWPAAKSAQTIKVSGKVKPGSRFALADIRGAGIHASPRTASPSPTPTATQMNRKYG